MPTAPAQQSNVARDTAVVAVAAQTLPAVLAAPVVLPVAGIAALAGAAAVTAAMIMQAVLRFLAALREHNRGLLQQELGRYSTSRDDIAQAVATEMHLEDVFARASADRIAAALPAALRINDPQQRAAAVSQILDAEQRYSEQRQEAMMARAIAAVQRAGLRVGSPLGAFWRLGYAKDHTNGCLFMANRFWPWAVLDRVHPPRHYGCTSSLHGFGEAIHAGWMTAGDVPDTLAAIRLASGVVMEAEVAAGLEAEFELRERLVAAGVDAGVLASRPWMGVSDHGEG